MNSEATESSGVQELIDRLHHDGVEKGKVQADQLTAAARQKAVDILDQAKAEAEQIVATARAEAERTRQGGEEAIRLAGRDTILQLTEELRADFLQKLRNWVGHSLQDPEFLRTLILEIGRHAVPAENDARINILLLDDGNLEQRVGDGQENALTEFVLSFGGQALRDGVMLKAEDSDVPGVRVQIVDDDLEVDLTTETLTELLVRRLSPQFEAIMRGVKH